MKDAIFESMCHLRSLRSYVGSFRSKSIDLPLRSLFMQWLRIQEEIKADSDSRIDIPPPLSMTTELLDFI